MTLTHGHVAMLLCRKDLRHVLHRTALDCPVSLDADRRAGLMIFREGHHLSHVVLSIKGPTQRWETGGLGFMTARRLGSG
jgi:hypothetical protein